MEDQLTTVHHPTTSRIEKSFADSSSNTLFEWTSIELAL
jgi:hypothetical protein